MNHGSQIVLENLTRIYENEEARELLVSEILAMEMLQGQREGGLSRAQQRIKDCMSPISTSLKGGVTDMSVVQAEARALRKAPGAVSATTLRVAGATRRDEKEAHGTWDIQKRELRQAWISTKQARNSKLYDNVLFSHN